MFPVFKVLYSVLLSEITILGLVIFILQAGFDMFLRTWSKPATASFSAFLNKIEGELTLLACLSTTNLLSCWWNSRVLPRGSEAGGASGIFLILLWGETETLNLGHNWWQSGYWLTAHCTGRGVSQGKPSGDPETATSQPLSATTLWELPPPSLLPWLTIRQSSRPNSARY